MIKELEMSKETPSKAYMAKDENKQLLLSIALKCEGISLFIGMIFIMNVNKDIAHGAKELGLHKRWSRRIIEEFYLQVDYLMLNLMAINL